jgi:hypothetical protein
MLNNEHFSTSPLKIACYGILREGCHIGTSAGLCGGRLKMQMLLEATLTRLRLCPFTLLLQGVKPLQLLDVALKSYNLCILPFIWLLIRDGTLSR